MKILIAVILLFSINGCLPNPSVDTNKIDELQRAIDQLAIKIKPMRNDYDWLTNVLADPIVKNCSDKQWPRDDEKCKRVASAMMEILQEHYQPIPESD